MTQPTGIAGVIDYQPAEPDATPNECFVCGRDFGEKNSGAARAIHGHGLAQFCDAKCAARVPQPAAPLYAVGEWVRYQDAAGNVHRGKVMQIYASWLEGLAPYVNYWIDPAGGEGVIQVPVPDHRIIGRVQEGGHD